MGGNASRGYSSLGDPSSRLATRFRRRFRIPYPCFLHLVKLVKDKGWFPSGERDAAGRRSIPVELKVLASLQILGRGTFYDDVSQLSLMSESTVWSVFDTFTERFAKEMFNTHSRLPTDGDEEKAMEEYHTVGYTVGASTAYHLSLRGVKPIVVERSAVAAAASGKAGGFLAGGWGSGPTVPLHEVSFAMHERLAEELGVTSYRKIPTLQVSGSGRRRGTPAPWLDGQATGHLMDPDTAQVTPSELTTKLMEAAQAKGAEVRIATVTGVSTVPVEVSSGEAGTGEKRKDESAEGDRQVVAVTLEGGEEVQCDRVIVAMGPWACVAEDWFGVPVPMQGIKSTSIEFEGSEAVANDPYALFCAEDRNGCHLEVYPRPTGEVYLCGLGGSDYVDPARMKAGGDCESPEKIGPDPSRVTAATKSLQSMSSVGNKPPTKSQACMRPCPPDGYPIMGEVGGIRGAYLSAGHNCWGILWGPVTGLLMAELLVDGKASTVDIEPFSPSRFMKAAGKRGRRRGATNLVGEQW